MIRDVICSRAHDVIMLQENWLTPHNMSRFDKDFPDYHLFGSSAMELSVEEGPVIGLPFGGTAVSVKNELLSVSECVNVSERFLVAKVGDLICINIYLPYRGTPDRGIYCIKRYWIMFCIGGLNTPYVAVS